MNSRALTALLAAAALLPFCGTARADDEVVAVLSSAGGAYLEAFSAFQAEYGAAVPVLDASAGTPRLPAGARTVVAFGGKAASLKYPPGLALVYAIAPGAFIPSERGGARAVKIAMLPEFRLVLSRLKAIQPGLERLTAFWMSPGFADYAQSFVDTGAAVGIKVTPVRVKRQEDLPAMLRGGLKDMQAFWLPPDPLLISPETLLIFREFSWNNGIPMYASTKGLAREGATASVGISFAESGAAAARAVKALNAGGAAPAVIFPTRTELTLNATAAKKCGVTYSEEILREADYLFP
ncbi:MAG: ABC transporter substrate binding protein [Elusimicrobiales bacterium]